MISSLHRPRRFLAFASAALLGIVAAASASAQVTFSFTTTAQQTGFGYTMGSTYTFVFTANGSYAENSSGSFTNMSSYGASYQSTQNSQGDVWTSFSGTGLLGTYVTPGSDNLSSVLTVAAAALLPNLNLTAQDLTGTQFGNIGLRTLDSTVLARIDAQINSSALPTFAGRFDYSTDGYQTPASFLTGVSGTYTSSFNENVSPNGTANASAPQITLQFWGDTGEGIGAASMNFTVSSLNISVSAIPEPSTYATLAGLVALGAAVGLRRRRQA